MKLLTQIDVTNENSSLILSHRENLTSRCVYRYYNALFCFINESKEVG